MVENRKRQSQVHTRELTGNAGSQDEGSFLKEQLKKAVRKGTSLYFYIFLILLVL